MLPALLQLLTGVALVALILTGIYELILTFSRCTWAFNSVLVFVATEKVLFVGKKLSTISQCRLVSYSDVPRVLVMS